jgi:drug/metabolite transporter (DMT)-like permease
MNWLPMALASAFFSASSDALAKALSRSASGRLLVWMRFFSASPWLLLLWPLAQPDTQTDRVFWFLLVIVIPLEFAASYSF